MLQRHRRAWADKAALRAVYREYFQRILRMCSPLRPIVEVGSGAGMFRECYPEIIATDVLASKWTDVVCDACRLPFDTASVGNLVMIDVFHHIGDPHGLLRGAARVLQPGGRIVMLEPWTSKLGYLFYRFVHHEQARYDVDPAMPFGQFKDAFDGNATLPRMFFDDGASDSRAYLHRLGLKAVKVEPLPAINWLLTGGFRRQGLRQRRWLPLINSLDEMLTPLRSWIALRAFVVLMRTAS